MLHGFIDVPTLSFWAEGNIWTGSMFQTFNYRISKEKKDETTYFRTVVWYGMKCFDLIPAEEYVHDISEEFSDEGLNKIIDFLNEKVAEYKSSGGRV